MYIYWILFANTFLQIFYVYVHEVYGSMILFSCNVFIFEIMVTLASKNELRIVPISLFLKCKIGITSSLNVF